MSTFFQIKVLVAALLILPLATEWGAALDVNDVMAMKRNGLSDAVIIEQVRLSGGVAATPEQAARLRSEGASEQLLATLTAAAPASAPAGVPSAPGIAAAPRSAPAAAVPVRAAAITTIGARPGLCEKEGWLSVANTDAISYFLEINPRSKRMFLSRNPNGGVEIPSGHDLTFNLRKETYKLYGESGEDLSIKIREGEPTRLTLSPFGVVGNSGLTGTAQDRDRVRQEVLFNNYAPPPVVIVRPPVIVTEPAPVVVVPGSPWHYPAPYRRHYYGYWW